MGRGAWRATGYGAAKSWTQLSKLNNNNCTFVAFIITILKDILIFANHLLSLKIINLITDNSS